MIDGRPAPAQASTRKPVRIRGLAAVGQALSFLANPVETMRRVHARHGPLVEVGPLLPGGKAGLQYLFAVGPQYNEAVLRNTAAFRTSGLMLKGPPDSAQRRVRHGLVTMNGEQHAHYRKLLLPPFRRGRVDAMAATVARIVDQELDGWPSGRQVDLWPLIRRVAQHVSIALLFQRDEHGALSEALAAADLINSHVLMNGSRSVRGCPFNVAGLPFRRFLRHAEQVEAELVPWAKKRKDSPPGDDLISLILNSPDEFGNVLDDAAIAGQVFTLFGASYETCQTVLTWTLFLLATHKSACADLLDEVASLDMEGSDLAERIEACTWLDAVLKEALRILPPVPLQIREAIQQADLGGHVVEPKTRVVLSPLLTNRLPMLFPDGDRFMPQRWTGLSPSQYEYLVFSAGPRMCIGFRFATNFLKIAIVQILRRFRIMVAEGARVDYRVTITISPRHGVPVMLYPQDRAFASGPVKGNIGRLVRLA